jgi:hypothetical protein
MAEPRGIEERLDWFLSHNPSGPGMCAQHTWHALGGDKGNPPAWGCSDANACVDKIKASGRYWTPQSHDGPPPRGAAVYWKYGGNGHAALSKGDGKIATTDPSNGKPTGTEPLDYPKRWGFNDSNGDYTLWTDQYNGVRFDVGEGIEHGPVYLSKLIYGQDDSDSVRRLQLHLNAHPLDGGQQLPVTGNYADQTDHEVRLCQVQHGFGGDPAGSSSVGPNQAAHLFTGCACTINDDTEPEVPPVTASSDYWYSGKPAGTLTFSDSYKRLDVDKWAPKADGLVFGMLYANVDGEGEFRVRLIRDPDDATAYQTFYAKAGDNCLITHVWFEAGEKGRPLWWEFSSMDGTTHTVGTRYAKFVFVG